MSKTFNDFLSSLNADTCEKIAGTDKSISFSLTSPGVQEYTNFMLGKSFDVSINVLQAYHDWLFENFDILPKKK